MKTLVLGSEGQLGLALGRLSPDGVDCTGFDLPEFDITNAQALTELCRKLEPAVIVNAAAYTAVDKAESELALATAVNVDGPRNIATAARDINARVIHVSTDFVFDGNATTPYKPDAVPKPLSVYGRTKLAGEAAVLDIMAGNGAVVRTAWLYSEARPNFVKTMLRLMTERDEVRVVADQIGTPTWADSLAQAVWALAARPDLAGTFHWTDSGQCSWYEFAVAIQEEALALGLLKHAIPIHPITTEEYPTAATRPRFSVLDCSAMVNALKLQPQPWRTNLVRMLNGIEL